jgi:AcrR family transcriptional regulator
MTPRTRKVSDDDVFAAAYRAMSRLGPGELTLAEIAAEAGVTASALVQRFGSRRELLLQLATAASDATGDFIADLRERHRSPLMALRAYAECMAGLAESPAALARSLAYLQVDLTDPDFRAPLVVQARATRAGLESLIKAAISVGELKRSVNPRTLVRTVEAVLSGSMMTWAIYQEGTAARWIRDELGGVLAPYLVRKRNRARSSAAPYG